MLFTLKQASEWASQHLQKHVTPANINYLIQYGRIESVVQNGVALIPKESLVGYYNASLKPREARWKAELGEELNWALSFEEVKEAETTKHVHRLHPYKGKFIPQLVAYFLDTHTDAFKQETCFQPGDIVLDPFCGSGTTLIEANEQGMHAIGVDVSAFNAFLGNAKAATYDFVQLWEASREITAALRHFYSRNGAFTFEEKLAETLADFNNQYFSISFKSKVRTGQIEQKLYGAEKEAEFLNTYRQLIADYGIDVQMQTDSASFINFPFPKPHADLGM